MLQYLITDQKYYTSNPITFKQTLEKVISVPTQESGNKSDVINIACFRDKVSSNTEELATIFVDTCKKFNIQKILINTNIELALKLNANGVHLTSTQFNEIKKAKQKDLFTIISCHSLDDIYQAEQNGADMVTYSPIFNTPNKGEAKGCNELTKIIKKVDIPVIALGGIISLAQIKEIKQTGAIGFASIRYFI